jgi:hypothetical protein
LAVVPLQAQQQKQKQQQQQQQQQPSKQVARGEVTKIKAHRSKLNRALQQPATA